MKEREIDLYDVNRDLCDLNIQYLMLARELCRNKPLEAIWRFNLNEQDSSKIAELSNKEIVAIAKCGRLVVTMPPEKTPAHVPVAIHSVLFTSMASS